MTNEDKLSVPNTEEKYWTKPRLELRTWFQKDAPSLGKLYEGALIIFHCPTFPGRIRLVSHAVREIRNRLPDYIAGPKTKTRFDSTTRLDEIEKDWKKEELLTEESVTVASSSKEEIPSDTIPIPRWLVKKISTLIKDHSDVRQRRKEAANRLFEGISPENQGLRDILRPQVLQWLDVTEWFVRKAHEPYEQGIANDDADIKEFQSKFELFEITLGALLNSFFKTVEGIDEILEETNS